MLMIAYFFLTRQLMIDSGESRATAYQVYVMRIWQEQTTPPVWRFTLEDPTTGQRRGFSCLSELTAYLENITSPQLNGRKRLSR
jgi:hypothetical protein